mmetsp:Transcript_33700/g.46114  ORF Transcript_33700/g.46114 Transcript_33700/m.46114 type:complete len:407 (+) Transcript_33700:79-1299(+)
MGVDEKWKGFQDLSDQLEKQPTFPFCEATFFFLAFLCLLHATRHNLRHVVVLAGALIGGTANDLFFMTLPFVDNFWHAQGTVMITPRLPLYIPCVYICFMYIPIVSSWRSPPQLPRLARFCLAGLSGALFYCIFDITGAKFLWWTWHDTDAGVFHRWLGVPVGSTLWTIIHIFCICLILSWSGIWLDSSQKGDKKPLSIQKAIFSVLMIGIFSTPLMMLTMIPFQLHQIRFELEPSFHITQLPGKPDYISLWLAIALFSLIVMMGMINKKPNPREILFHPGRWLDGILFFGVVIYCAVMAGVMIYGDPSIVVAEGVHQEYGDCRIVDYDLSNYARFKYLCAQDYNEDFVFNCVEQILPPHDPAWYTLCGKAHTNYLLYAWVVASFALCCVGLYAQLLFNHPKVKSS